MKTFIAILVIPLLVIAIEAINTQSVCDRFITSKEQKSCMKRVEQLQPDSYLSGVCQKQFNDETFWECMELGTVATFEPKKTETCDTNGLSDAQRLDCLKNIANYKQSKPAYQQGSQRAPSSIPKTTEKPPDKIKIK